MTATFIYSVVVAASAGLVSDNGAAVSGKSAVNWISWEKAIELNKINQKKIFVDVYTAWCGWCKVMDRNTFADSAVAAYMNNNFYCVKLDAERKDTILYNNYKFKYIQDARVHELAYSLLNGKMSYPSFVVLTEKEKLLHVINGYQEKDIFLQNLKTLAEYKE